MANICGAAAWLPQRPLTPGASLFAQEKQNEQARYSQTGNTLKHLRKAGAMMALPHCAAHMRHCGREPVSTGTDGFPLRDRDLDNSASGLIHISYFIEHHCADIYYSV